MGAAGALATPSLTGPCLVKTILNALKWQRNHEKPGSKEVQILPCDVEKQATRDEKQAT